MDGCSHGSPGESSVGGILLDHKGNPIRAFQVHWSQLPMKDGFIYTSENMLSAATSKGFPGLIGYGVHTSSRIT